MYMCVLNYITLIGIINLLASVHLIQQNNIKTLFQVESFKSHLKIQNLINEKINIYLKMALNMSNTKPFNIH